MLLTRSVSERGTKMAFNSCRRSFTTLVSRGLSHKSSPSFSSTRTRFSLAALAHQSRCLPQIFFPIRSLSTEGHSPLNDPSPNWNNRPPKESILLEGCDYEHWLVILDFPDPKPSNEEMVRAYVETLGQVLGSEEEAVKNIYSVSTSTYTGFGCLISEELSNKVKEIPNVLWVLPDSYLDVPNRDYGGDLFVDGKVIRRPQYDFIDRQHSKPRNRAKPDRRRESMQGGRTPRLLNKSSQEAISSDEADKNSSVSEAEENSTEAEAQKNTREAESLGSA